MKKFIAIIGSVALLLSVILLPKPAHADVCGINSTPDTAQASSTTYIVNCGGGLLPPEPAGSVTVKAGTYGCLPYLFAGCVLTVDQQIEYGYQN